MTLPVVFGLGSSHGDDQAGWLIIEALWEFGYPKNYARKATQPADLLDWMQSGLQITVCDACLETNAKDQIWHWSWPADDLVSQILWFTRSVVTADSGIDTRIGLRTDTHRYLGNLRPELVADQQSERCRTSIGSKGGRSYLEQSPCMNGVWHGPSCGRLTKNLRNVVCTTE